MISGIILNEAILGSLGMRCNGVDGMNDARFSSSWTTCPRTTTDMTSAWPYAPTPRKYSRKVVGR